jgi:DNA-binding CsgD family transcriptional regulator
MGIYSHDHVTRLIGLIYDAAMAPDQWGAFLDALGTTIDGHFLNLSSMDASERRLEFMAVGRYEPEFAQEYKKHYWTVDPWVEAANRRGVLRAGLLDLGERFVPSNELKKTEFYSGIGRRFDFLGGLSALFDVEGSLIGLSASQRRVDQFGDRELELVRTLLPHIHRAVCVHQRLERAERITADATSVLDRVGHGVLFVSATGRLLFANGVAVEMLRSGDGLVETHGELRASAPAQTRELRAAIAAALSVRSGIVAPRPVLLLSRPSGRRPLVVIAAPLPSHHLTTATRDPAAAIFVTDPERGAKPDAETIALILRLTPAEARLAACLAAGEPLNEAAERLGIQLETARKRLKTIFQKTDTHRQADLIRVVLQSLSPLSWSE